MTFILIMLFIADYRGGSMSIVAEFNTREACEYARAEIVKAHKEQILSVRSQGCYPKGKP